MRLQGKIALVTGASRGIGKAIALQLAADGAQQVVITYKSNHVMALEVVTQIQTHPAKGFCYQVDVTSRPSIQQLAEDLKAQVGSIDILVNNAGINLPNDFDKISDEDWDRVLDTNLKSVFRMGQEFAGLLRPGGAIVNISSVSGQYGGPRSSHYAASKAGLLSLTQNMAIFFARNNIRVNAVSPGLIESDMAAAANQLGLDDRILLKRRGTPSEVASAVSFLASGEASYITAQVLNVNGGLYF